MYLVQCFLGVYSAVCLVSRHHRVLVTHRGDHLATAEEARLVDPVLPVPAVPAVCVQLDQIVCAGYHDHGFEIVRQVGWADHSVEWKELGESLVAVVQAVECHESMILCLLVVVVVESLLLVEQV